MAGDATLLNAVAAAAGLNLEGAWFAIQDGATGADQVSEARAQPTYAPGATGVEDLTGTLSFTSGAGAVPVTHLGVYGDAAGATFRFAVGPLGGDTAFNAAGDLDLTAAPITVT